MENNDVQHIEKLKAYWDENQAFPSMSKLREVVAMGSTASVFEMVARLVEAGQLQRVEGRIAPTKAFLTCPMEYAEPEAHSPVQGPSALNLLDYAMPDPRRTFFVTVTNDQLAAKDLLPGDLLVMQEDVHPQVGDIVATRQAEKLWLNLLTSVNGRKLVLEPAACDIQTNANVSRTATRGDIAGVAIAMVRRFDRVPSQKAND